MLTIVKEILDRNIKCVMDKCLLYFKKYLKIKQKLIMCGTYA